MKTINKSLVLNSIEAYNIFSEELPNFARRHKQELLNITVDSGNVGHYAARYTNYLSSNLSEKGYNKVIKLLENNKCINIELVGTLKTSNMYLKECALKHINKDVYNITYLNAIDRRAEIDKRLISDSLRNTLYEIVYDMDNKDNGRLMRSILNYVRHVEYEKGTDRHFTIKKNGQMTYTPSNKETIINDDAWSTSCRQEIKYGKGLRKMLSTIYDFEPKYIELLSNKISEKLKFCGEFRIVTGKDITLWYHYSRYGSNTGSLRNSCMKHSSCQEYFGIYEDSAKMLIATNKEGDLIGRALLWDDVKNLDNEESFKFMDRIYGNDVTIEAFKTWAYANGYYHKAYQNYETLVEVIHPVSKSEIEINMSVEVTGGHDQYPYLDTFRSTDDDIDDNIMTLKNNSDLSTVFSDTNGYRDSDDYVYIEGDRVHIDDASYVERHGEYFHSDDVVYTREEEYELADECEYVSGHHYHRESDEIVYSEYEAEYIIRDEATFVDDIWYPQDAECLRWSEHLGETVHEDDVVYSDSLQDYIPLDEAVECHIDNTWILKENAIEVNISDKTYYANAETYTQGELIRKIEES